MKDPEVQLPDHKIPRRALLLGTASLLILGACYAESEYSSDSRGLHDKVAQQRAAEIISTFENSTTEIQYGYAENIGDGRGITAGRAGFCSGTGDMLEVVETYSKLHPGNVLEQYIKPLKSIDEQFAASNWLIPVASVNGLEGLEKAWANEANDENFRLAQDNVFNKLYLEPAIKSAESIRAVGKGGIRTAVGQLIILDTSLQHGTGEDKDSVKSIINETSSQFRHKVSEHDFLNTFLDIRQKHLENAANPDTREAWSQSVGRVNALRQILDSGNTNLRGSLNFEVYQGDHYELPPV